MKVNFPANCNSESSRWSFTVKLNEKLRIWHNGTCVGMTSAQAEAWRKVNFYHRVNAVMAVRNEQIEIAKIGAHWNPKIPDHVSGGIINYPNGLNKENEGSRAIFLFGVANKLNDARVSIDSADARAVHSGIVKAKIDAINGGYWNPSLGDIS